MTLTEECFELAIQALRFAGFYTEGKKSLLLKFWSYFLYLAFVWALVSVLVNLFLEENLTNMQLNQRVLSVVVNVSACFKMLPFLVNGPRIKSCIDFFGDQRFNPRNEEEKKIWEDCIRICRRNVTFYWVGLFFCEIFWCCFKFFSGELPLNVFLPYNFKSSNTIYCITFFVFAIGIIYLSLLGHGLEPLIGGLMYQATCQMKILKYILQNLDKYAKSEERYDYEIKVENAFITLKRCVLHHNDILDFLNEFENCFSFPIFSHLSGTTFALCYSLIGLLLTSPTSVDGLLYATVYFTVCFQIYFYCYFGTLLYEENEQLICAVYMGEWYRYDIRTKKLLIIIMERSKKPLILTAGTIVNLTFDTLTWVLKTSYSLVAVLNNYH